MTETDKSDRAEGVAYEPTDAEIREGESLDSVSYVIRRGETDETAFRRAARAEIVRLRRAISARAEGVAALQQAGDLISRENLEAELRETIGLYVREAVTRMFSEENATYRCARQIAGMLQPGYYLHRKLFSSPLPQQTALVGDLTPNIPPDTNNTKESS